MHWDRVKTWAGPEIELAEQASVIGRMSKDGWMNVSAWKNAVILSAMVRWLGNYCESLDWEPEDVAKAMAVFGYDGPTPANWLVKYRRWRKADADREAQEEAAFHRELDRKDAMEMQEVIAERVKVIKAGKPTVAEPKKPKKVKALTVAELENFTPKAKQ